MTTPKTMTVPRRAMYLREPMDQQSLAFDKDEPQRFSMVALTGKPLPHWWFGTLSIDLQGLRMKQKLPVLKDHDTDQRLGFTTSMQIDGRGVVAEGKLMKRSAAAQEVMSDHADGFPWQASTLTTAHKVQRLASGEESIVNGHTVRGPAVIFREATLREVTFTALGVDDDTSAVPLSGTDADEEIALQLIENESMTTKTTDADPAAVAAAAAAVKAEQDANAAALAAKARDTERARTKAILAASIPEQAELRDKLITDGTPEQEALAQLSADLRTRFEALRLAPKKGDGTASLAGGNTAKVVADNGDAEKKAKLAALPDGEERWKAEFAGDIALQEEFGGNVSFYLGWKRNEQNLADAKARGKNVGREKDGD